MSFTYKVTELMILEADDKDDDKDEDDIRMPALRLVVLSKLYAIAHRSTDSNRITLYIWIFI